MRSMNNPQSNDVFTLESGKVELRPIEPPSGGVLSHEDDQIVCALALPQVGIGPALEGACVWLSKIEAEALAVHLYQFAHAARPSPITSAVILDVVSGRKNAREESDVHFAYWQCSACGCIAAERNTFRQPLAAGDCVNCHGRRTMQPLTQEQIEALKSEALS